MIASLMHHTEPKTENLARK